MIKASLPAVTVLMWVLCISQASASDAIGPFVGEKKQSGHFTYAVYNNQWLLTGEKDDMKRLAIVGVAADAKGELVIPEEIDGMPVYGIYDGAFKGTNSIETVSIPNSIKTLNAGIFSDCWGLKNIKVAEDHPNYASVGGHLYDKRKTKLIAVGSGHEGKFEVPEGTTVVGQGAFANCANITHIFFPQGVTDIGGFRGETFMGCSRLEVVEMPDTVTNIGQKSFMDCGNLEKVIIPPKVTRIPFGLFWRCQLLKEVTLPEGITEIGNYAFADCAELKLSKLPSGLKTLGAYAFKGCQGLKGITVPETVTDIGRNAFHGVEVILPDSAAEAK